MGMEVDDATLKTIFGTYGTVTWSKVFDGKGKPTKAAIVEFGDIEEAKWVVENLNGNIPQGLSTPVQVAFKAAKKGKGFGKGKDFGKGKGFSPYEGGKSLGGKWGGKGFGDGGYGKGFGSSGGFGKGF